MEIAFEQQVIFLKDRPPAYRSQLGRIETKGSCQAKGTK